MDVDSDQASPIQTSDTKPGSDQSDDSGANLSGSVSPAQGAPVAGPRHAPTYSVVNAILEKKDDGPGPRCGHTLTAVPAVGEEGSATYIGPRLILFGGATALEGNSGGGGGTGTPTSAGSAGISVLLHDLLVAEDLAAAETTNAASHAAAAAASNVQTGRLGGRDGFVDARTTQPNSEESSDGAVVLGNPVAPPANGDMYTDISTENAMLQRRLSKGVDYLVEASAAEAEAISATLAAAKARQVNGEVELPDRDRGSEATPSGKQISTLIKPDSAVNSATPAGVRLHHRAVVVAAETGGALGGMVGVILGADSRATERPIVTDKNCEKIHYMAPNFYCWSKRNPAFVMRVSDDEMENEECNADSGDVESRALVVGTRFACDDDFSSDSSEDSEHELVLNGEPYLMEKMGLVEGVLSELTHEHRLVVMEEVRNQISTLEADLADKNEKFTSAIARVEKYSEACKEMEKKRDLLYQRTVAEDLDKYITGVQRRHDHRFKIEERKIIDDAVVEEAKRRQEQKHRQEKFKSEAEMQARLEAVKKRVEEDFESQRAAKEAAEKLVAENLKKAAALAISPEAIAQTARTRANAAEKSPSSGTFLRAAKSALNLEVRRSQIYKEVVAETEALRRNMDLRNLEMQIARRIRQITGTTESVRGKAKELVTLISNSTSPRSSTAMFAEKIVLQCVNPSGSFSQSVYAYARVIILVASQVPQTMDILLAELNRVCIYTVPKYMSYSESMFKTEKAYYKAIGYQEEDGKLEDRDTYLERVRSCMKLYGALVQTEVEGVKNPHGIEEGWAWMARFFNALPANLYTAVSLQAFIEMAGFTLYRRYRSQFKKILNIVSQNFVSALKQRPDLANVVMNIQVYIESSKFLEEPDGRRLKSSLLSSEAVPESNHEGSYHHNSSSREQYHYQSYRQYY